jgi:SAM-dependent methyltransferase
VFNAAFLGGALEPVEEETIGGLPYLVASAGRSLDARELACLSNVSSLYALFERRGDLLAPIAAEPWARHSDDLVTIQRYTGKTNELFTKLMLNVTVASSPRTVVKLLGGERVRVFDPVCGRGTSLNQALMYGMDAAGIEIDKRDYDAYSVFIRTWLKNKRLKHHAKSSGPRRLTIVTGEQTIDVVNDDTINAGAYFAKSGFDVIIGDLPYGVQHAGSPRDLLERALPTWRVLLKGGGTIGLAWNVRRLSRADVIDALRAVGLEPFDDLGFEHRVDRTITRDLVVALKPA